MIVGQHIQALIAVALTLLVGSDALGQMSQPAVADFEDLDKTMTAFEAAFDRNDEKLLRSISERSFERSPGFGRLRDAIGRLHVNSSRSSQMAEQTFEVVPGGKELRVTFRLTSDHWVVSNADAKGLTDHSSANIPVLAREYFFSDFRRWFEEGRLAKYAGVAPAGGISIHDFNGRRLISRPETTVTVLNLALHDGSKVRDLIYLRVRKSEKVDGGSRGWLIASCGSMVESPFLDRDDQPVIDFLQGDSTAFDLTKRSEFVFSNAAPSGPSLPVLHATYNITKVGTSNFSWEGDAVHLSVFVETSGASWRPSLNASIVNGALRLETGSDVVFAGVMPSHRYLATEIREGIVEIRVKQSSELRPIESFDNAIIRNVSSEPTEGGIRFVVKLTCPKRVE